MAHDDPKHDWKRDLEHVEPTRASVLPEEVPDPVETRDPASQPVPRRPGQAYLFAIPVLVLALIGLIWFLVSERRPATEEVGPIGTTGAAPAGEGAAATEGLPRGDEAPLYAGDPQVPVVSSMAHLLRKQDYVGRPVEIAAIPVNSVKGPRTFEVGRLTNRTRVVVDGDAGLVQGLEPGQVVRLSGQLAAADDAQPPAGLTDDERQALSGEDVFIRATLVQPQPQDAGGRQAETP